MTLERIRAGDVGALEELVRDVWTPLVRHLRGVAGSPDAAEDAAQEALVRLWERRERWQGDSARALVFRIARNAALDHARRTVVRARSGDSRPAPMPVATPAELLEAAELRARFAEALAGLALRRREVFELVRFGGLTYQEVGEVLELSPQTVANHMSLALRDLRADLADLLGAGAPVEIHEEGRRPQDG